MRMEMKQNKLSDTSTYQLMLGSDIHRLLFELFQHFQGWVRALVSNHQSCHLSQVHS